jgi:hypothetical protein
MYRSVTSGAMNTNLIIVIYCQLFLIPEDQSAQKQIASHLLESKVCNERPFL